MGIQCRPALIKEVVMDSYTMFAEAYCANSDNILENLERTYSSLFDWIKKNPSKSGPSFSDVPGINVRQHSANKNPNFNYAMNLLPRDSMSGNFTRFSNSIDKHVSIKGFLEEFIGTLIDIQRKGVTAKLMEALRLSLLNQSIHSTYRFNEAEDPEITYVDQVNFYDKNSGALEQIAFIPFGCLNGQWSILGAAMIKKNRFNQGASKLNQVGKNNIRALRGWANSKGWQKLKSNPEQWGIKVGDDKWLLKIKAEASSREGQLQEGSGIARFDARLGDGLYINPFTGKIGGKKVGTHLPLEEDYF